MLVSFWGWTSVGVRVGSSRRAAPGDLYNYGVTRKAALAAFEAFAVEALRTVER
jgi:hypothetical protein